MSETAAYQTRKPTRVRMLGDAVPTYREFRDDEPKVVPKTADELRADRDAARDAAPMAASCGVDGCTWAYTGTAGDCRTQSATHRAAAHPELAGRRTHRKGTNFKRRGEPVDPAVVAESRRLRQERDDQQRLDTINRGRALRGEQPLEGATSMGTTCKIDGCDEEAPSRGRYARLCATHRPGSTVSTGAAAPSRPARHQCPSRSPSRSRSSSRHAVTAAPSQTSPVSSKTPAKTSPAPTAAGSPPSARSKPTTSSNRSATRTASRPERSRHVFAVSIHREEAVNGR